MSDATRTIDELLARGRTADAVHRLDAACAAGDVDALFKSAAWHLVGEPVRRDLAVARDRLRHAVTIGHVDAALLEIALTANGSGGPPSWASSLALLREAATADPLAAQHLALVSAMHLDPEGRPAVVPDRQPLRAEGGIFALPAFLSPAECAHVAQAASDLLEPAMVVDSATGRQIPHPIRTSDAAVIGPMREDLVVRAINLRIAAATATDVGQGEALTVLRYRPGQQFRLHSDALPAVRNQRVKTLLIYLNGGFMGGETVFPDHDLTVRPVAGDALLFDNMLDDGKPDPRSRHAGLPVTKGVKWLATRWIRARPFDPWTGPEAA